MTSSLPGYYTTANFGKGCGKRISILKLQCWIPQLSIFSPQEMVGIIFVPKVKLKSKNLAMKVLKST